MPGGWAGSTRKARLPDDWPRRVADIRARDKGICYLCGQPGADTVDHVRRGDDHSLANLAQVHDRNPPHCHRYKTSAEGNAARERERRPAETHPGVLSPRSTPQG